MNIVIATNNQQRQWYEQVILQLPEYTVSFDSGNKQQCDYALVWQYPNDFFIRTQVDKGIFVLGAGFEHLQTDSSVPNVPLHRLVDCGMGALLAQYVVWAIVNASRCMGFYTVQQRQQRWHSYPYSTDQITVAIVGCGVLGLAIATSLHTCNYRVLGYSRSLQPAPHLDAICTDVAQLPTMLAAADVVVNVLPGGVQTRGFLSTQLLQCCKAGCHIVQIGRGETLSEAGLLQGLEHNIGHATLDVFAQEPLPADHPFWQHPKITMTPHIAAITPIKQAVAYIASIIQSSEPS